jgi:hypothetical protein
VVALRRTRESLGVLKWSVALCWSEHLTAFAAQRRILVCGCGCLGSKPLSALQKTSIREAFEAQVSEVSDGGEGYSGGSVRAFGA